MSKGVSNSFTRNLNIQIPKNPIENNLANYQSTNFNENNQKVNSFDSLRMYQSNLPNNTGPSTNVVGNSNTNYSNSFVNNNNSNQLQGPFQVLEKVAKNADYHSRF